MNRAVVLMDVLMMCCMLSLHLASLHGPCHHALQCCMGQEMHQS